MKIEKIINEIGLNLPISSPPGAKYTPVKQCGNSLYVSGQIPLVDGKVFYTGKIGEERDLEYGEKAAKVCIINMLAALKNHLGDLDKIKNVTKLLAFVSSANGFDKQHLVINAASELLINIFGESGQHARSAIGVNQLPMDATVEIEGIFEIWEA